MSIKPRKKQKNIVLQRMIIFSTVFFICFLIFCGVAGVMYITDYSNRKPKVDTTVSVTSSAPFAKPINILTVITDGDNYSNAYYTLIHLDLMKASIPVTAIPPETIVTANGRTDTLSGQMTYGGVLLAKAALEKTLNIKIDKFAVLPISSYEDIINKLGGLNYNVAGNLLYKDSSGKIITSLESGRQNLFGSQVSQLLRYPLWQEGKIKRVAIQADVTVMQINQFFETAKTLDRDELFKYIINRLNTDISSTNYSEAKDFYGSIAASKDPAKTIHLPGDYVLDDSKTVFKPGSLTEFVKNY